VSNIRKRYYTQKWVDKYKKRVYARGARWVGPDEAIYILFVTPKNEWVITHFETSEYWTFPVKIGKEYLIAEDLVNLGVDDNFILIYDGFNLVPYNPADAKIIERISKEMDVQNLLTSFEQQKERKNEKVH